MTVSVDFNSGKFILKKTLNKVERFYVQFKS